MERIKSLDGFQKAVLVLLMVMTLVFGVAYSVVSSRVGFLYMDAILQPREENGNIIYAGNIRKQESSFLVTPDKTVTFRHGDKTYGPYIVKEDPTAVPQDHEYMTGVEILQGDEVFFRGGFFENGGEKSNLVLVNENGDLEGFPLIEINGKAYDSEGNLVDQMSPSATTILLLTNGPELTSKADWLGFFYGILVSIATAISILFADDLFRFNLAFQIRNVEQAEPSDWEITGRYIGWILLPVLAFAIYLSGVTGSL